MPHYKVLKINNSEQRKAFILSVSEHLLYAIDQK